jgi:hypothetical protein
MACTIETVHTAVQRACGHAMPDLGSPSGGWLEEPAAAGRRAGLGCCGREPLCSGAIRSQCTGPGSLLTRHLCVRWLWCRDRCW